MKNSIRVQNVTKTFQVPEKGQKGIKSIFYRKHDTVEVIKNISFNIKQGEFVGYIGPNGAGKSTTIKLLTGILYPTSGSVSVLGFDPHKQRYKYTYNIGVVFGQRSLLEYDIAVQDSMKLYKAIYEIDDAAYEKRLAEFADKLNIKDLLHIPVRKLSLGQRMRCEIAASLLHNPKIIFLDEPTIGLDALAKQEIRAFLKHINEDQNVTVLLTTHDMDDIEQLAKRIILINEGSIMYDGKLTDLKRKYVTQKDIEVVVSKQFVIPPKLKSLVYKQHGHTVVLRTKAAETAKITQQLLATNNIRDLRIHEPDLEEVVKIMYTEGETQ